MQRQAVLPRVFELSLPVTDIGAGFRKQLIFLAKQLPILPAQFRCLLRSLPANQVLQRVRGQQAKLIQNEIGNLVILVKDQHQVSCALRPDAGQEGVVFLRFLPHHAVRGGWQQFLEDR